MRISDWSSDVCFSDLSDRAAMNIAKLREAVADSGVTLLGAVALEAVSEAEKAKEALAAASADLLAWEKTLPGGKWMERRSEEHTSELQSLMRISYAVFCLKKKNYRRDEKVVIQTHE